MIMRRRSQPMRPLDACMLCSGCRKQNKQLCGGRVIALGGICRPGQGEGVDGCAGGLGSQGG
eukprot:362935-Chlamydomonas_euryale.AAC.3